MLDQVLTLKLLSDITINPDSEHFREFKWTTFGKAIETLTGVTFVRPIVDITEENLLYEIKHGKVDERIYE